MATAVSFYNSPDDLKKRFAEKTSGAFIFCGKEDYLIDRWLERFRALADESGFYEMDRVKLDFTPGMQRASLQEDTGRESSADIIAAELSVPPIGSFKLVEVHGLDIEKLPDKDIKQLCGIFSEIDEYTAVIFVFYGGSLVFDKKNSTKKVFKTISECAYIVDFAPMAKAKTVKWLVSLFKSEGIVCSPENGELLCDSCENMLDMENCVKKISAYLNETGKSEVDRRIISDMTEVSAEAEIYNYTEAVLGGNKKEAFRSLAVLGSRKIEPIVINASLGKAVWSLASVRYSKNDDELKRSAGLA
ncbi:MAG: hypothetical protein E7665_07795, partial [Ruminococcaceae bacterium]|nr:hypothetical protein [Oscillospiraceae bacterium]